MKTEVSTAELGSLLTKERNNIKFRNLVYQVAHYKSNKLEYECGSISNSIQFSIK